MLESTKRIKGYVNDWILPLCRKGEALIVIPRKASKWGINEEENVHIYRSAGKTSGASLTRNSEGGKAIIEFIEKKKELFNLNKSDSLISASSN